jgi:uncharacterized protein (UPF0332 family)
VTPEASAYFDKAQECLEYARGNITARLGNDAGRNAYLAMFHAAQALIYERTGKAAKTHTGVHTQFNRLAKSEPNFDAALRRALPQAYNLKAVADYETGPDSVIPPERAQAAIVAAKEFVAAVRALVR